MPPVCKFWLEGNCRFAERCRFEHPVNRGGSFVNGNRFGALADSNSNSNSRNDNSYQSGSSSSNQTLPYQLDKNAILTDLTNERPQWILSAYGPGRFAPAQLFGGLPREQSFEEMRLLHYMGLAAGNPQQVVHEAEALVQQSEQQMQTAINNIDSAIQYLINAEKEHPNRIDIVKAGQAGPGAQPNPFGGSTTPFGATPTPAFGAPSQPSTTTAFGAPSTGAFGKPSQLGQKPNPFGASTPAFGAPSQLGTTSAFGQPSQLGNTGAFGQPSQLGTTGTFGQPAQLGQKPNPFGAPSGGGFASLGVGKSVFGQPATSTAFGAPSQPAVSNPFGTPSQPAASSPFGAPSQPATSSPFGAPSQPAQANPFAQKPIPNANPFGASSQPAQPNPFGAPSPAPANPFSAPSQPGFPPAFSQPSTANPNAFGNPQPTPAAFSGFGRPPPTGPSNVNPPPALGAPRPPQVQNGHSGQSGMNGFTKGVSSGQTDINAYSTRDANGRLLTFKGNRVIYNKEQIPGFTNRAGKWERIWFPNGPPAHDPQAYLPADRYNQVTKDAYEYARQNGRFKDGIMPTMPPLQEMCHWDF